MRDEVSHRDEFARVSIYKGLVESAGRVVRNMEDMR